MRAETLMKVDVITVAPDLPVAAAHQLMRERHLRHLPVVVGDALAGIVSDRDILLVAGKGPNGFVYPPSTVGEIMSLAPLSAGSNVPVSELARIMLEAKIDCLPIITRANVLLGVVTSSDLLRVLAELPPDKQPAISFQILRAGDMAVKA